MNKVSIFNNKCEQFAFGSSLIDELANISFIRDNATFNNKVKLISDRFHDDSFKIAVVGAFSSGKSTFLNALMGNDYLIHGVQQTTATVTFIYNKKPNNGEFGVVRFVNGDKKTLCSYSELKEVTTTQSRIHNVIADIDSVEIYIPFLETDIPVVLIDTPGLNGVLEKHSERTFEIIQSVHACIYMFPSKGLDIVDINALNKLSQYQSEFIMIMNFIDNLKESEGDTLVDRLEYESKRIEDVFQEQNDIHYTLCGVSSLYALVGKVETIDIAKNNRTHIQSKEDRTQLYEKSNFEDTLKRINTFMQEANERVGIVTLQSSVYIIGEICEFAQKQFELADALWQNSSDAQIIKDTQRVIDGWAEREEKNCSKLDNLVASEMHYSRELLIKETPKLITKAQESIFKTLKSIDTAKKWDDFIKKNSESAVRNATNEISVMIEVCINKDAQYTYSLSLSRVKEYAGVSDLLPSTHLPKFKADVKTSLDSVEQFKSTEDHIEVIQKELTSKRTYRKYLEHQKDSSSRNIQQTKKRIRESVLDKERIDKEHKASIAQLGTKPPISEYTKNEQKPVDREGFGRLFQWLIGKKTVNVLKTCYDDSNQRKWEEKVRIINENFNEDKRRNQAEIENMEFEIKQKEQEIAELESDIISAEAIINSKLKTLELERINLAERKEKAAREFLELQKRKLQNNITEYFDDIITPKLKEHIRTSYKSATEKLKKDVRNYYIDVSKSQRENLIHILSEKKDDNSFDSHTALLSDIKKMESIRAKLEEYLCAQLQQIS
jgi:GTPase SAR1 family protein